MQHVYCLSSQYLYVVAICFSITFFEKRERTDVEDKNTQYYGETKRNNDYVKLLSYTIWGFYYLIYTIIFDFLEFVITGNINGVLWYIMGRTFLFYIPIYIAEIFVIKNLRIIKRDFENNPPDYKRKEIEQKLKIEKENKQKLETEKIINVIERIGIKFFVENFYTIKNLSLIDAIDDIDNKLPYEEKRERVCYAKKLFDEGLEIKTLQFIINEKSNMFDEAIKEKITLLIKENSKRQE